MMKVNSFSLCLETTYHETFVAAEKTGSLYGSIIKPDMKVNELSIFVNCLEEFHINV